MSTDYVYGQPALEFEQAHGLSGIAGRYRFPAREGLDRLSLQHRIWPPYGFQILPKDEIAKIFGELEKLNPDVVGKIVFDRNLPDQVRDVVHGMVSGFNADDINLFMRRSHGNVPINQVMRSSEEITRKAAEITIMQRLSNKCDIRWVASEPTLEHIWQQVKDRPVINSIQRAAEAVHSNVAGWAFGVGALVVGGYLLWEQQQQRAKESVMGAAVKKVANENCEPCHTIAYLNHKQGASTQLEK